MGVQKGKYPTVFSTIVLERALGEKGLKDLYEQYTNVKHRVSFRREPTDKEQRIANAVKTKRYTDVAKEFKIDVQQVYGILNRVSRYTFLKQ